MKKYLLLSGCLLLAAGANAQGAMDAMNFTRPDLKGTARFMSMGGAFGALGGDLSTLSQNPAGIGVYRQSEVGFTLDIDNWNTRAESQGLRTSTNGSKVLLNNIGAVATLRLPSNSCPNLNFGFTYNKGTSFNRTYSGRVPQLKNSMTNYIAGMSNANNVSIGDVTSTSSYDPYIPNDGYDSAPWLSILGYDSYFINPSDPDNNYNPGWRGQWGEGTAGNGYFSVNESGSIDEFNIALGGNINNIVYWGMNFDIVNFNFTQTTEWGENLTGAYVPDQYNDIYPQNSNWSLQNYYNASGTGFNYQLGFIVKPIQQLRLGIAMHTPTWYNLTETYYANTNFKYGADEKYTSATTNNGYSAQSDVAFRSQWKFIFSAAGVIGNRLIVSADYELTPSSAIKYGVSNGYYNGGWGWDYDDDWWDYYYSPADTRALDINDPYYYNNQEIKQYLQTQSTIRIGAEYRVTPQFSIRAGYAHTTSPVKSEVRNNQIAVATSGTQPSYRLDNYTNYVTAGLGYRFWKCYIDLAYVYKNVSADYHAYSPDPENPQYASPMSALTMNNHQIVISAGFKF